MLVTVIDWETDTPAPSHCEISPSLIIFWFEKDPGGGGRREGAHSPIHFLKYFRTAFLTTTKGKTSNCYQVNIFNMWLSTDI